MGMSPSCSPGTPPSDPAPSARWRCCPGAEAPDLLLLLRASCADTMIASLCDERYSKLEPLLIISLSCPATAPSPQFQDPSALAQAQQPQIDSAIANRSWHSCVIITTTTPQRTSVDKAAVGWLSLLEALAGFVCQGEKRVRETKSGRARFVCAYTSDRQQGDNAHATRPGSQTPLFSDELHA